MKVSSKDIINSHEEGLEDKKVPKKEKVLTFGRFLKMIINHLKLIEKEKEVLVNKY